MRKCKYELRCSEIETAMTAGGLGVGTMVQDEIEKYQTICKNHQENCPINKKFKREEKKWH